MTSVRVAAWTFTLTLALQAACSETTTILLHITPGDGLPTPESLSLSVFVDEGRVVDGRRLPEEGAPRLPDTVVLYPRQSKGQVRMLVVAHAGGAEVGSGTTTVELKPGEQVVARLIIEAVKPLDSDGDGVPDAIDNCPTVHNPDQGPCGGPDAGGDADAGPRPDGPIDGPKTDALKPDTMPPLPQNVVTEDGWGWHHPWPQGDSLHGIWGSSASDIWAVGAGGTIIHYDGKVWRYSASGTTRDLYGVWGSSATDIWAVGEDGTVLHYDGKVWNKSQSGSSNLRGIWGSKASDIWAVGDNGVIYHHDGKAWVQVSSSTNKDLYAVRGTGANDVWAAADGRVLHYDGTNWQQTTGFGFWGQVHDIWPSSASDVWCVGTTGKVRHYDGNGWSTVSISLLFADLNSLWGSSPSDLWIAGDGGKLLRYDGNGWKSKSSGTQRHLFALWGANANDIWAVGQGGEILHYDGTSWSSMVTVVTTSVLKSAWRSPSGDLWVVGNSGTVLRYDGNTWTKVTSGTGAHLTDISGVSKSDIWAVGSGGTTIHYDGSSWSKVNSATSRNLNGVWASGPSDVWHVGGHSYQCNCQPCNCVSTDAGQSCQTCCSTCYAGRIGHYDGTSWSSDNESTEILHSVWGTGPGDVWAVGDDGMIRRHTSGSWSSWSKVSAPTGEDLRGVWGSGAGDVWAVGQNGVVLKWGGSSWSKVSSGTSADLHGVWAGSATDVWAVGNSGTIVHHDGSGWSKSHSGTIAHLFGVWGMATKDVWAVGGGSGTSLWGGVTYGVVLHYDDRP
jgi:hypothetical protein